LIGFLRGGLVRWRHMDTIISKLIDAEQRSKSTVNEPRTYWT
jgi:hypothetical protein